MDIEKCGFSKGTGEYLNHSRRMVAIFKKKSERLTDPNMSEAELLEILSEYNSSAREAVSSLIKAAKKGNEVAGEAIFMIDLKGIYGKELGDFWESSSKKIDCLIKNMRDKGK